MVPYETRTLRSGDQGLTGIEVVALATGQAQELKVDGFFMAIGHRPIPLLS